MSIKRININRFLTTTFYDPSPHRLSNESKPVSERTLPLIYSCEKCGCNVSFKTEDFRKHNEFNYTNLQLEDKKEIDSALRANAIKRESFIDFYCPNCKQATTILFTGGPSGYWGQFAFNISHVFVSKSDSSKGKVNLIKKIKRILKEQKIR